MIFFEGLNYPSLSSLLSFLAVINFAISVYVLISFSTLYNCFSEVFHSVNQIVFLAKHVIFFVVFVIVTFLKSLYTWDKDLFILSFCILTIDSCFPIFEDSEWSQ